MRRVIVLMGTADDAEAKDRAVAIQEGLQKLAGLTRYLLVRAGDQRRASGGRSRFAFVDSRKLRKISEGCCQGARNARRWRSVNSAGSSNVEDSEKYPAASL